MKRPGVKVLIFVLILSAICSCSAKPTGSYDLDAFDKFKMHQQPEKQPNERKPRDPVLAAWLAHHERLLKRLWETKPFKEGAVCKVLVFQDGTLSDVRMNKSSGSKAQDEAALNLLREAGPFHPMPPSVPKQAFLVKFKRFPTVELEKTTSVKPAHQGDL